MNRVAVVTGGASGIGAATVDLLRAHDVDVSDPASVARGVENVRQTRGPIEILVNAAGIPAGGPIDHEQYVERWERALSMNLNAAMYMVRACLDDLVANGRGRIVNVASTEAFRHPVPASTRSGRGSPHPGDPPATESRAMRRSRGAALLAVPPRNRHTAARMTRRSSSHPARLPTLREDAGA